MEGGQRETSMWERTSTGCLLYEPRSGIEPETQVMCPVEESNTQPFGYRTMLQPTEPHHPGPLLVIFKVIKTVSKNIQCKTSTQASLRFSHPPAPTLDTYGVWKKEEEMWKQKQYIFIVKNFDNGVVGRGGGIRQNTVLEQ